MKSVVIFGSSGFTGLHAVKAALEAGEFYCNKSHPGPMYQAVL